MANERTGSPNGRTPRSPRVAVPRLSGSASETDVAVLWTDSDLRCVLSWLGDRYRVRLMRGDTLVREESGTDEDILLDAATRWRTEIALVEPARKDTRG